MATFATLLEPFGAIWARHTVAANGGDGCVRARVRAKLEQCSDDHLKALRKAARRPTETNCWQPLYDVAPIVSEEARLILASRRRQHQERCAP